MKKLFLFVAAICCTMAINAKTYSPEPGTNQISALAASLANGDTIMLVTGTYAESVKTAFESAVTFIAAEGEEPVIAFSNSSENYRFKANVKMEGLKITHSTGGYVIRSGASLDSMIFRNCTISGNSGPLLYTSDNTIGKLVIDNCILENVNNYECGGLKSTGTITELSITNSTIRNFGSAKAIGLNKTGTALIDHCTFYNCAPVVISFGGDVETSATISNNIIANATLVEDACISIPAGTITNCLYYNIGAPAEGEGITISGSINEDPKFVDAENGDLTLGEGSPAIDAATDGTSLGDPYWYPKAPEPVELTENFTPDLTKAVGLNEATTVAVNENILTVTANADAWAAGGVKIPFDGYVKTENFAGIKGAAKIPTGGVEVCAYVIDQDGKRWYQESMNSTTYADWASFAHTTVPFVTLWDGGTAEDWANAELVAFGFYGASGDGLVDFEINLKDVEILVGKQPVELTENFFVNLEAAEGLNEQTIVAVNENILTVTANADAWAAGGVKIPFDGYVKTENFAGIKGAAKIPTGGVEVCAYVIDQDGKRWYQESMNSTTYADWASFAHTTVPFVTLWDGGTAEDWKNAQLVAFGFYGASGSGLENFEINLKEIEILVGEQTALNNVKASTKAVKAVRNGQIVIERNGVRYNVLGAQF